MLDIEEDYENDWGFPAHAVREVQAQHLNALDNRRSLANGKKRVAVIPVRSRYTRELFSDVDLGVAVIDYMSRLSVSCRGGEPDVEDVNRVLVASRKEPWLAFVLNVEM